MEPIRYHYKTTGLQPGPAALVAVLGALCMGMITYANLYSPGVYSLLIVHIDKKLVAGACGLLGFVLYMLLCVKVGAIPEGTQAVLSILGRRTGNAWQENFIVLLPFPWPFASISEPVSVRQFTIPKMETVQQARDNRRVKVVYQVTVTPRNAYLMTCVEGGALQDVLMAETRSHVGAMCAALSSAVLVSRSFSPLQFSSNGVDVVVRVAHVQYASQMAERARDVVADAEELADVARVVRRQNPNLSEEGVAAVVAAQLGLDARVTANALRFS